MVERPRILTLAIWRVNSARLGDDESKRSRFTSARWREKREEGANAIINAHQGVRGESSANTGWSQAHMPGAESALSCKQIRSRDGAGVWLLLVGRRALHACQPDRLALKRSRLKGRVGNSDDWRRGGTGVGALPWRCESSRQQPNRAKAKRDP